MRERDTVRNGADVGPRSKQAKAGESRRMTTYVSAVFRPFYGEGWKGGRVTM